MNALLAENDLIAWTALTQRAGRGSTESIRKLSKHMRSKLCSIVEKGADEQKKSDLIQHLYFNVVDINKAKWQDRVCFFLIGSACLRRILAEAARHRRHYYNTTLTCKLSEIPGGDYLIKLDDALQTLSQLDDHLVKTVEGHYFGDMNFHDMALALGISAKESKMNWLKARGWLYKEVKNNQCFI